ASGRASRGPCRPGSNRAARPARPRFQEFRMKRLALGLTMLLSACVQAQDAPAAPDKPGNLPAPVLELQKQGLRIEDTLPAPTGFRGYVARFQGRAIPIYVPPGGQYAMIGTLIDANGNDLTEKP